MAGAQSGADVIVDDIRAAHARGEPLAALSRRFGISHSGIQQIVYKPGAYDRLTGESHRARVAAGLSAGEALADIARAIGWHVDNLPALIQRLGLGGEAVRPPVRDLSTSSGPTALAKYDDACRAVAEARTAAEAVDLMGKADAVRTYARQAKNRGLECDAAEIRIRAERRLGELLDGEVAPGRRPNVHNDGQLEKLRLADLGVDRNLSSRAQALARLPEAEFARDLSRWRDDIAKAGSRVTVNLLREREKAERRDQFRARTADGCSVADLDALVADNRKFGVILADPPWHFETYSAKGEDRAAPYRTDPLRDIAALPVHKLAAKDCVLFLWCIAPMLREALDLVDAWTFDLKTVAFTWMKQNKSGDGLFIGNGYWTRANAEFCLLATRGAPMRLDAGVPQAILSPVREHSRKPDETHERIERLVGGPYLELYARRPRAGWTTWGNEIPREDFVAELERRGAAE